MPAGEGRERTTHSDAPPADAATGAGDVRHDCAAPFVPAARIAIDAPPHLLLDGHRAHVLARLSRPHVVVLGDFLDAEECDALVACSRDALDRANVIDSDGGGETLDDRRTSELTSHPRGGTPLLERIERRIAALTGIPVEHGEGLQVMRYGVGAEYQPHFDHFDPARPGEADYMAWAGQRVASLVLYLNDVEAGGATVFPQAGFEVLPRKGGAVYFAYAAADGRCDPMALHGGAPVVRGEKWIATKWLREREY